MIYPYRIASLGPRLEVSHDTKVSAPSLSPPPKMKFLQQLVSKKISKQSSSKHATPSSTERKSLETAAAILQTEPPKISLENVADNLPRLDDNTLLCILQALTSPVALTKARMVSTRQPPCLPHWPHRFSSDMQAAIRIWRRKDPMDVLGPRTVPAGAAAGFAQACSPPRRQCGATTAGRPQIAPIAQEYMLSAVTDPSHRQYPA